MATLVYICISRESNIAMKSPPFIDDLPRNFPIKSHPFIEGFSRMFLWFSPPKNNIVFSSVISQPWSFHRIPPFRRKGRTASSSRRSGPSAGRCASARSAVPAGCRFDGFFRQLEMRAMWMIHGFNLICLNGIFFLGCFMLFPYFLRKYGILMDWTMWNHELKAVFLNEVKLLITYYVELS